MTIEERSSAIDDLTASCQGAVLRPGDAGYPEACTGWNLAWTHRPAVIVRAASESDVVHTVRYAAAHGLTVAVQNTGHGVVVPADERSALILTADLADLRIDPQAQTATVGGGTQWGPVLEAAQQHGLSPLMGSAPNIGAVGYSLGGGFSWLVRKYGMAVDNIHSLRVVLANGEVVTTSASEEPELFWALCGSAGSNLGVVVEMDIALAPVADVYAGNLFYPLEAAREVFERYGDWSQQAPAELTSAFNITAFPPLDMVPEPMRGKTFVLVRGCYAGTREDGNDAGTRLVDQWRNWRQPIMDTWGTIPFARSAEISMDPVDPLPAGSSARWIANLDHSVLEAMLDALGGGDGPSPILFAEIRHGGGAIGRDNPRVSYAARDGERLLEVVGLITGPEAAAEVERRLQSVWQQVSANLATRPGYLNFLEGPEKAQAAAQVFGSETLARLAAAKHRYDPQDLFRHGVSLNGSV